MNPIINLAIYQIVWFACILDGDRGALYSLPLLGLHLAVSDKRRADIKMMGLLLLTGLIIDGGLNAGGFFTFNTTATPIPFWLMVIWLGLATLIHHSLAWLKPRLLLSSIFGALGGPAAYWSGVRMGAAEFNYSLAMSLLVLACIWAVLWPGLISIARKNTTGPS